MSKAAVREPGWYWVKCIGPNKDWEVARRFSNGCLWFAGHVLVEREWEIGPRILDPEAAALPPDPAPETMSAMWKRISPREMLGPEQRLLSDSVDVWIGHQAFGDDGMEWRTNDESFWDRTPTHYADMPELPGEEPS